MTITQEIAQQAAQAFETKTRDDGSRYTVLVDGRPDWLQEAVYNAHDGMFPDDYVYKTARDACETISESEDPEESAAEFADDVDVYTGALTEWLSSHGQRVMLCDEATDELGACDGITSTIQRGQYLERERIYTAMREAIEEAASESEEE